MCESHGSLSSNQRDIHLDMMNMVEFEFRRAGVGTLLMMMVFLPAMLLRAFAKWEYLSRVSRMLATL